MQAVLSKELRVGRVLNKHPGAGGQKRRREGSTQCRGDTVPPAALHAEHTGHPRISSADTYKALCCAGSPAWHCTCIISLNPYNVTMMYKEVSHLQKMAILGPLYVKGHICSSVHSLIH